MTSYRLNHFTLNDASALTGKVCDITEWGDDECVTKITYPAAWVTGIITRIGPYLVLATTGAVVTDAAAGTELAIRPAESEWLVAFTWISEVTSIRDGQPGK